MKPPPIYLDPRTYDDAERLASELIPNRIIECSQPNLFQWEGYPTRVHTLAGVRRYVDVMHEGRLENTFNDILEGGITGDELNLMREVARAVRSLSEAQYGKAVLPKDALARSLNIYRQIRFLYPDSAVVFELGAGSGYVGALLLLSGYTYVATDISQAFYLFQNHLMNAVAPGRLVELVDDPRSFFEIADLPEGSALHVPWWKFVALDSDFRLAVNVVTANHCLCEMHPRALAHAIKACKRLLANGGVDSRFAFEGWGSTARNPIWSVNKAFWDAGFVAAHCDTRAVVYVRADSALAVNGAPKKRPSQAPAATVHDKPSQSKGLLTRLMGRNTSIPVEPAAPPRPPTMEELYHPPIWITPTNAVSDKIMKGRQGLNRSCGYEDFLTMLAEVHGSKDFISDDEKFLRGIGTAL